MNNYTIRIARYPFTCPITGTKVRKGDSYTEIEGIAISINAGLPEKNNINLKKWQKIQHT